MYIAAIIVFFIFGILLFFAVKKGWISYRTLKILVAITGIMTFLILVFRIFFPEPVPEPKLLPLFPTDTIRRPIKEAEIIPNSQNIDINLANDSESNPNNSIKSIRMWDLTIDISREIETPRVLVDGRFIGKTHKYSLQVSEGFHKIIISYNDELGITRKYCDSLYVTSDITEIVLKNRFK